MSSEGDLAATIKAMAAEEGFARAGVAPARPVGRPEVFRRWLAEGMHAGMAYLARNVEKRFHPAVLVPDARSVICLAVGYAPSEENVPVRAVAPADAGALVGMIARCARGRDYHRVLKRQCLRLMDRIRVIEPTFAGRAFVDSAPLAERSLAAAAGVGWIGRNGCLIVPGLGSYVVLCMIVCNLPLATDSPVPSQCESCGRCAEACPTGAILADGLVDARRCISYLTIEHRDAIPSHLRPLMGTRLFGCDACQEACPFNRDAPPGDVELRGRKDPLAGAGPAEILRWTEADWDAATRGSAIRRATLEMLRRNVAIAAGNSADTSLLPALREARAKASGETGDALDWAIARLTDGAWPSRP